MITDEVKRSFTKWLSGSKANTELPYPPEKKSASDFSRACRIPPNEAKQMLCEVGNCRKRAKRVLRVKLNSAIRKQKLKNSVRGVAALFRRVAPKGGLTVAPFGIFDKRKSPIPSQSHFASRFGLR